MQTGDMDSFLATSFDWSFADLRYARVYASSFNTGSPLPYYSAFPLSAVSDQNDYRAVFDFRTHRHTTFSRRGHSIAGASCSELMPSDRRFANLQPDLLCPVVESQTQTGWHQNPELDEQAPISSAQNPTY